MATPLDTSDHSMTTGLSPPLARQQTWGLDGIAWEDMHPPSPAVHEVLFYMVTSASFVESATDVYTRNLVQFYAGDPAMAGWLEDHWEPEELQHGRALRRYVQLAWPFFDWDRKYAAFLEEFTAKCEQDGLESSAGLEAVSRCVVEMGTATYYTAIRDMSPDPVLAELANLIRQDEIRHYKYFFRAFGSYRIREGLGRLPILRAILRRLRMLDEGDSSIALKHAYALRHPDDTFDHPRYRQVLKQIRRTVGRRLPVRMGAKMTLKPLRLNHRLNEILVGLTRYAMEQSDEEAP